MATLDIIAIALIGIFFILFGATIYSLVKLQSELREMDEILQKEEKQDED